MQQQNNNNNNNNNNNKQQQQQQQQLHWSWKQHQNTTTQSVWLRMNKTIYWRVAHSEREPLHNHRWTARFLKFLPFHEVYESTTAMEPETTSYPRDQLDILVQTYQRIPKLPGTV